MRKLFSQIVNSFPRVQTSENNNDKKYRSSIFQLNINSIFEHYCNCYSPLKIPVGWSNEILIRSAIFSHSVNKIKSLILAVLFKLFTEHILFKYKQAYTSRGSVTVACVNCTEFPKTQKFFASSTSPRLLRPLP
jgi:hypothetical protein